MYRTRYSLKKLFYWKGWKNLLNDWLETIIFIFLLQLKWLLFGAKASLETYRERLREKRYVNCVINYLYSCIEELFLRWAWAHVQESKNCKLGQVRAIASESAYWRCSEVFVGWRLHHHEDRKRGPNPAPANCDHNVKLQGRAKTLLFKNRKHLNKILDKQKHSNIILLKLEKNAKRSFKLSTKTLSREVEEN